LLLQTRDDEDPELEHGKPVDDMWALNLTKYTVKSTDISIQAASSAFDLHVSGIP
jgi:hypothetical protein